MKIVITCGHPCSGLHIAHDTLTQAGLMNPLPSGRESLSVVELHEKIFKANDLALDGLHDCTPLSPGKIWQMLAMELFAGNLEQTDWGWADARSVWLLDFWKNLDPQIRFVLMYSTPEFAIGRMAQGKPVDAGDIETFITSWIAYQTEILRFYNRNPDRCLLVNIFSIRHDPIRFIEKSNETFGLNLSLSSSLELSEREDFSAIAVTLAKALVEDNEEAQLLYAELESTADLADDDANSINRHNIEALAEYSELLARVDTARDERHQYEERINRGNDALAQQSNELQEQALLIAKQEGEIQLLTRVSEDKTKLANDLKSENTRIKQEHAELKNQFEKLERTLKDVQSQGVDQRNELTQENELLLLQLHQVQEELEQYYLKWKELSATNEQVSSELSFAHQFWYRHQPDEIHIDFRGEIAGRNWYDAESDGRGRWAGPDRSSTIQLPPLRPGHYALNLEVMDAMTREIVTDMELLLNGVRLDFQTENRRKYPITVSSNFVVEENSQQPITEMRFKFPKVISPEERGADDKRHLAIRIRSLKLQKTA